MNRRDASWQGMIILIKAEKHNYTKHYIHSSFHTKFYCIIFIQTRGNGKIPTLTIKPDQPPSLPLISPRATPEEIFIFTTWEKGKESSTRRKIIPSFCCLVGAMAYKKVHLKWFRASLTTKPFSSSGKRMKWLWDLFWLLCKKLNGAKNCTRK